MATLNICYYYKPSGDFDAFTFVGEPTEKEAIKYAENDFDYSIPKEDIEGVYPIKEERDVKRNSYKITLKKIK